MEQILVYIIVLALLILTMVAQKKKKKQAASADTDNKSNIDQSTADAESMTDFFNKFKKEIFSEFDSQPEKEIILEPVKKETEKACPDRSEWVRTKNLQKKNNYFEKKDKKTREKNIQRIAGKFGRESDYDLPDETTLSSIDINFDEDDEVKKAIIYSEIFNKKYFEY